MVEEVHHHHHHHDHEHTQVHPISLHSLDSGFATEIENFAFCWRWFTRAEGESYRVLTIEKQRKDQDRSHIVAKNSVIPANFKTEHADFHTSLGDTHSHYFNWRWVLADNNGLYRMVTLENTQAHEGVFEHHKGTIDLSHLVWDESAASDHSYEVQWRWIKRDEEDIKVLTLE